MGTNPPGPNNKTVRAIFQSISDLRSIHCVSFIQGLSVDTGSEPHQ